MRICVMKIIWEGAIYRGVLHQGNSLGGSYPSTVLCDWFYSLISSREKILKEDIDTLKEISVITTICSENDHKNKRKQLLWEVL